MSEKSALRSLQAAIQVVRDTCTGPECKALLAAVDAADSAAEQYLGQPDDSTEDKATENQSKTLEGAGRDAVKQLAQRRKSAAENSVK